MVQDKTTTASLMLWHPLLITNVMELGSQKSGGSLEKVGDSTITLKKYKSCGH